MSEISTIEWTDSTWNPVRGCVKVSPGCKHCYAETFAERFRGVEGHPYEQGFDPRLVPGKLAEPLSWEKPRRVFVNSMSDLLGEFVPGRFVAAVFGVMALACHHTYQVLTKRAQRLATLQTWNLDACLDVLLTDYPNIGPTRAQTKKIRDALPADSPFRFDSTSSLWPLPNVHLGVTVEAAKYLSRIDDLRKAPTARRFVSFEPLLQDVGELDLRGIDQVIVGAESGHSARPMDEDWVRSIRDQAQAAGVAFFYKQRLDEGGRKVSLPMLDGRQWAERPA